MRKLASVQKIKSIAPIAGKDRIGLATVLGWHVIVNKREIEPNDLVVFCEPDSIIPDKKIYGNAAGERIKTMKMAGVVSEGICFPLTVLPEGKYEEGQEVTDLLGIKKYESDERNGTSAWWRKKSKKPSSTAWYMRTQLGRWLYYHFFNKPKYLPFPDWIPRTNETRCQVLGDIFFLYRGTVCDYTEKLCGSSVTFYLDKRDKLHVCSQNTEIMDKNDFMYKTVKETCLESLKVLPRREIVVQGEIIGPGVQGNLYRLDHYEIYAFQMIWPDGTYLSPSTFSHLANEAGFKIVPTLGTLTIGTNIDYYIDLSKGKSKINPNIPREGIVVRPLTDIYINRDERFAGGRLSFKALNPDFLTMKGR